MWFRVYRYPSKCVHEGSFLTRKQATEVCDNVANRSKSPYCVYDVSKHKIVYLNTGDVDTKSTMVDSVNYCTLR